MLSPKIRTAPRQLRQLQQSPHRNGVWKINAVLPTPKPLVDDPDFHGKLPGFLKQAVLVLDSFHQGGQFAETRQSIARISPLRSCAP